MAWYDDIVDNPEAVEADIAAGRGISPEALDARRTAIHDMARDPAHLSLNQLIAFHRDDVLTAAARDHLDGCGYCQQLSARFAQPAVDEEVDRMKDLLTQLEVMGGGEVRSARDSAISWSDPWRLSTVGFGLLAAFALGLLGFNGAETKASLSPELARELTAIEERLAVREAGLDERAPYRLAAMALSVDDAATWQVTQTSNDRGVPSVLLEMVPSEVEGVLVADAAGSVGWINSEQECSTEPRLMHAARQPTCHLSKGVTVRLLQADLFANTALEAPPTE